MRREEHTITQPWVEHPPQDMARENNAWGRENSKYNNEGRQHVHYTNQSHNHPSQSYHDEVLSNTQYEGGKSWVEHSPLATAHVNEWGRENTQYNNREMQDEHHSSIKQNHPSQNYSQEILTDRQNEVGQGQRGMAFLIQLVQHVKEELKNEMMDFKHIITAQLQQQMSQTTDQVNYQPTMREQSNYQPSAPVQSCLSPPGPVIDQTQTCQTRNINYLTVPNPYNQQTQC